MALYLYTKYLLQDEIEEELYSNKDRVEQLLLSDSEIKGVPPIMVVKKVNLPEKEMLKDTILYDPFQNEVELFRQLSGTKNINGQEYRVTVRAMVIESEDILSAIVLTFFTIILLAFIFLFYLNKSRNEKLWAPFFVNLSKLKSFSLKSDTPLKFEDSDILEFHELNSEMETLTSKIQADYRNLKQFTEDVSHEMQTPLAIMQGKIDTIINDTEINEMQFAKFTSLQEDIQRLKQLNKKLNLLAKIENNQFTSIETILINELFNETISSFSELTAVEFKFIENEEVSVKMDNALARILCNNLISNAVKHSTDSQPVQVVIERDRVNVINAGIKRLERPEQIFDRFFKESKQPDSTGLGLSIVKKICDHYGFVPSYRFCESEKQHSFQIRFNT